MTDCAIPDTACRIVGKAPTLIETTLFQLLILYITVHAAICHLWRSSTLEKVMQLTAPCSCRSPRLPTREHPLPLSQLINSTVYSNTPSEPRLLQCQARLIQSRCKEIPQ